MASQFSAPTAGAKVLTTAGDLYLGNPTKNQWRLQKERATAAASFNPAGSIAERMTYPMFGHSPIVYENLQTASNAGIIRPYAGVWTGTTTNVSNAAFVIDMGRTTAAPATFSTAVTVPPGYGIVWVRALNIGDRNTRFRMYFDDSDALGAPPTDMCYRHHHYGSEEHRDRISPYGGQHNNPNPLNHQWVPLSLPNSNGGTAYIQCVQHTYNTPSSSISGLAFTENPWNYTDWNGYTWHRGTDDGAVQADWWGAWNGKWMVTRAGSNTATPVVVNHPVVDSGADKVLNLITLGDNSSRLDCPIAVNNVNLDPRASMIETLEPFKWSILTRAPWLRVTSYVIPAAVIAAGATPHFMEVEVRVNQMKNLAWYTVGSYCCDLNA